MPKNVHSWTNALGNSTGPRNQRKGVTMKLSLSSEEKYISEAEAQESEDIRFNPVEWRRKNRELDEEVMFACFSKIEYNPELYTPTERERPYAMPFKSENCSRLLSECVDCMECWPDRH
jgi:hypothetical protein